MQVDTRERGFSYAYDAPLDMRMDPDQELSARDVVNSWDERQLARLLKRVRRGALRRPDRPRDRAPRAEPPIDTTQELVDVITAAIPAPGALRRRPPRQAHLPGHPDRRQRGARRSSTRACPLAWDVLRAGGRFAGISFHSLEDRRVKRFLADARDGLHLPARPARLRLRPHAGGRAADPARDRPDPGEIAENPRAKSARLRAARKLTEEPQNGRANRRPAHAHARAAAPPHPAPPPPRQRTAASGAGRRARAARDDRSPRAHARDARDARGRPPHARPGLDRDHRHRADGIVAMQVSLLKMNSGIGRAMTKAGTLERQNADLEAEIASLSSSERVRAAAAAKGMLAPARGGERVPAAPAATATRTARPGA